MRRTKEDAALTREQLLKAALHTFSTLGYTKTTLDEIAKQAGTTRGAIHWHFGSKAELYNTLVRETYTHAWVRLKDVFTMQGTPLQVLRQMLIRWLSYPEEDAEFRAVLELTILKTEVVSELDEGIQEKRQGNLHTQKIFADLLARGIAAGELRPDANPEIVAIASLGLIGGVTNLWLMDPTAFSLKQRAPEIIDTFLHGLVKT